MAELTLEHLTVEFSEIPCEKTFTLDGTEYSIEFNYNDVGDFFTFVIKKYDGTILFAGKLNYLRNALFVTVDGLPDIKLIPVSLKEFDSTSFVYDRISKDNFDAVRICIV